MQRLNTYQLYQLGNALRPLVGITAEQTLSQTWWNLFTASRQLGPLINNPTLKLTYCRPAAEELLIAINVALQPILTPKEGEEINWDAQLGPTSVHTITNALGAFEHNLSAELQQHDTYLVSQKGIYSTGELIERAENLFSEATRKQMPAQAIVDIRQAGRCLAFDLPTATGFHILRATEAMIVTYMDVLNIPQLKDSQRNWGIYIQKLKDVGANVKVIAAIDQIRELHRNPTLHPEVFLDSDEALALLGMAQSVILGIVADIERRSTTTAKT